MTKEKAVSEKVVATEEAAVLEEVVATEEADWTEGLDPQIIQN